MTDDKNYFVTLDENVKTHITLSDGKKEDVVRKGTIAVKTKNDSLKLIYEVFYVPGLAQNLLSVGQLIKKAIWLNLRTTNVKFMIKIRVR